MTRRSPRGSGGLSFVEGEKFACHGLSAVRTALTVAPRSIDIVMQFRSVAIATPQVQNVLGRSCARNSPAAFDVERAGNGVTVGPTRARTGKPGIQTRPRPHGPPRQPSTLPGSGKFRFPGLGACMRCSGAFCTWKRCSCRSVCRVTPPTLCCGLRSRCREPASSIQVLSCASLRRSYT